MIRIENSRCRTLFELRRRYVGRILVNESLDEGISLRAANHFRASIDTDRAVLRLKLAMIKNCLLAELFGGTCDPLSGDKVGIAPGRRGVLSESALAP